jgi:hypothetical protein
MTRTDALAKVKELGIKTERPAHQTATAVLVSLIEKAQSTEEQKARGRKINPTSARQARLAAQAALALEGPIKKGRRPNATSARQQRLAAIELRKANGEVIKRGRPALAV